MHYQITEQGDYLRAVIGNAVNVEDFEAFYKELQTRCESRGLDRALVVVLPEGAVPAPDRLAMYAGAGFIAGFKLALVCATWAFYQACNKAEQAAADAGITVRAFLQEMEGIRWLLS